MKVTLTVEIRREGEWFVAFCPEVPEANGQGRTQGGCLASLREAILLLMEDRRGDTRKRLEKEAALKNLPSLGFTSAVSPRKGAEARRFAPGFRISGSDLLILLLGCAGAIFAGIHAWWMGLCIAVVTARFFLFCNVFRISRRPELIWAGTFILLTTCTIFTGFPGWLATIAVSLLVAAVLIIREMRKPSYHGVGWATLNPDLRKWWEANLKSDPASNP